MISKEAKEAIHKMIFERAYEIEEALSADNYFKAKMAGIKPEQVSDVALKCATKELKQILTKQKGATNV